MSSNRSEPKRKRHHNIDGKSKRKDHHHPEKIIDINDACLVKIFEYLDNQSLFNVAIAHDRLRPLAHEVYQQKFSYKKVHLTVNNSNGTLKNWLNCVRVQGFRACLQYLRCFGSSIASLTIDYSASDSQSTRYEHIHRYINKYCVNNLFGIVFWHMPSISIDNFVQPFVNVVRVIVWQCDLGDQLPSFVEWFPNLQTLYIDDVRVTRGSCRASFQHLEHLCFSLNDQTGFNTTQALHLLRSNRQLRNIEVQCSAQIPPVSTLLNMIQRNPFITMLNVMSNGNSTVTISSAQVQQFVNEHPLLVQVNLRHFEFSSQDAFSMVRQLKSLRAVNFQVHHHLEFLQLQIRLNTKWTAQCFGWSPAHVRLQRNR